MTWLADLILFAHFALVVFVIAIPPLALLGRAAAWRWTHNRRLRLTHLGLTAFIALEAIIGVICPLTWVEYLLRREHGRPEATENFLAYWVDRLLFYDLPPVYFTIAYIAYAAFTLAVYRWAPPQKKTAKNVTGN